MKWYPVNIWFETEGSDDPYYDMIQGRNIDHALDRAYWNWPDATIIQIINQEG